MVPSAPPVGGFGREFRESVIVAAVLVGAVLIVFWQQVLGVAVFIGESDRLNSYLNIRLAEYDALKEFGRVPNWSSLMFGGFSISALHWMNPGVDLIGYILQFVSRESLYLVLGYVMILSVLAACATSYFYIRDLVGPGISAAAGAVCYGLSVFSLHRAAQVDNAHLVIVLLPLALLAIRRVKPENPFKPFFALVLIQSAMAVWGFLQEVAYVFCFLGAYAIYRACVSRGEGNRNGVATLLVFSLASILALALATPRIVSVGSEISQLARTNRVNYTGYWELLRFFHEGIYCRYFEECRLLDDGINVHEGLQLVSSTMLVIFVCLGALRPRTRVEAVAGSILLSFLLGLVTIETRQYSSPPSLTLALNLLLFAMFFLLMRYSPFRPFLSRFVPDAPRPADTSFHIFAICTILALTVTSEGYSLVYHAFGKADFSHTRLSILALLPLSSLFAVYLAEMQKLRVWPNRLQRNLPLIAGLVLLAAVVAWLIHGPALEAIVPRTAFQLYYDQRRIVPTVVVEVLLTFVTLVALVLCLALVPIRAASAGAVAMFMVATFAIIESMTYAHLKVAGAQTWTYPVPFRLFNYLNVPPAVLRPPGDEQLAAFAMRLEGANYRSMFVSPPWDYRGVVSPHIAAFWRIRTVGGYGAGTPKRLAELPWIEGARTLRTIELRSMQDVDPALLALLNVKYIVLVTSDLYFNVALNSDPGSNVTIGKATYPVEFASIDGVAFGVVRNPVSPLPRHFLVSRAIGVSRAPRFEGVPVRTVAISEFNVTQDPVIHADQIDELTRHSLVEGLTGVADYDASGSLAVEYREDRIDVWVEPSNRERFLVVNERYHPGWKALTDVQEIRVFPTNAVMMGIRMPPGVDRVQLQFESLAAQARPFVLATLAIVSFIGVMLCGFQWPARFFALIGAKGRVG